MTTATKPAPHPAPAPARRRRSLRWLRIAGPVAVVIAAIVATGIVHATQQADPADHDYLSPDSRAPIGSSRLADALRGRGVRVTRVTTTYQASSTLWAQPDSTLFVTTPGFTDAEHLTDARWYPPGSHVVVVRPDDGFLSRGDWPVRTAGERWAAAAPAPGCALFGEPAAARKRYYRTTTGTSCYRGGVVQFPLTTTISVVGAADPFRNDRLDEHGNRPLALSLLGGNRQVIWLDLHADDRWPSSDGPPVTDRPAPDGTGRATDDTSPPTTEVTPDDGGRGTPDGGAGDGSGDGGGDGDGGGGRPRREPNGAAQEARREARTFPPQVWAVVLLVLAAGGAFAAASARRLGTPVAERLPSRVPANETMLGHARLYERGGSLGPSLSVLQQTARRRLADHLGLLPDATDQALAAASGLPVERFTGALSAPRRLRRNADLVAATKRLRDLIRDVINEGDNQ
jgi:uncharacterized membrane protein YgcG